jgi:hypothetical protein
LRKDFIWSQGRVLDKPEKLCDWRLLSFIASVGLWCLIWAALPKSWIRQHKSTSLISTEILNYSHTRLDPLGVTFALGGTLVNALVIYLLLPMLDRAKRGGKAINLRF